MSSARAIAACYGLSPADRSLCAMPLFHVHGLVGSVFAALASGGSVILPRRVAAQRFVQQMHEYDATWYSATPTIHQMLVEKADMGSCPPSLRFIRSCSSALAPALLDRLEEMLSVPVLEAYGMTEASHQIASNPPPPGLRVPGSVGISTGTELRVVGPDGNPLPDGAMGEVVIRGPAVMTGYLDDAEGNARAFVNGWFRTGDRGILDGGYLLLRGRLKEMINRGGENISPYEIEETLLAHPAVADVACFGTPSVKYGEEVAAAVVTRASIESRELLDYCRERLASFKVPKTLFFVDEVPRTATGKIRRREISAELQASE